MKTVICTGNSHGIGLAISEKLREEGYFVPRISRTFGYDLMTKKGLNKAKELAKQCDFLVNNVGGMGTCKPEDWSDCMQKNYGIMVELTLAYLSKKRGFGRVITISSIYGKERGLNPVFDAAKAAQIAFMKGLSGTIKGTTFNTICPGYIRVGKAFKNRPKKLGDPEDVANLVNYLISSKANFIDGAVITVDGGLSCSY